MRWQAPLCHERSLGRLTYARACLLQPMVRTSVKTPKCIRSRWVDQGSERSVEKRRPARFAVAPDLRVRRSRGLIPGALDSEVWRYSFSTGCKAGPRPSGSDLSATAGKAARHTRGSDPRLARRSCSRSDSSLTSDRRPRLFSNRMWSTAAESFQRRIHF